MKTGDPERKPSVRSHYVKYIGFINFTLWEVIGAGTCWVCGFKQTERMKFRFGFYYFLFVCRIFKLFTNFDVSEAWITKLIFQNTWLIYLYLYILASDGLPKKYSFGSSCFLC